MLQEYIAKSMPFSLSGCFITLNNFFSSSLVEHSTQVMQYFNTVKFFFKRQYEP
jgi:hypothetical protein